MEELRRLNPSRSTNKEERMKYRKKPVVIHALKYIPDRWEVSAPPEFFEAVSVNGAGHVSIRTLRGDMTVNPGDYVIRGVKGEFYPCEPDIFEMTYEEIL
jgi:hypothetical protein